MPLAFHMLTSFLPSPQLKDAFCKLCVDPNLTEHQAVHLHTAALYLGMLQARQLRTVECYVHAAA